MGEPAGTADLAVRGIDIDAATRCAHYNTPLDIVAIRMHCCGEYYACRECHDALADHVATLWPLSERDRRAIRCGNCRAELSIAEYLAAPDACPRCGARFNPGCRNHRGLYFA